MSDNQVQANEVNGRGKICRMPDDVLDNWPALVHDAGNSICRIPNIPHKNGILTVNLSIAVARNVKYSSRLGIIPLPSESHKSSSSFFSLT